MGTDTAGERGGHWFSEEDPHMPAVARSRPFECSRNRLGPTGSQEGLHVPSPRPPIEVGGEESAGVVHPDGIDADRVTAAQVRLDHFVRHGQKGLMGADPALDFGLAADAGLPFVAARGRIARPPVSDVLPALRKHIVTTAKQATEQSDLVAWRRAVGYRALGRASAQNRRSPRLQRREPGGEIGLLGCEPCETFPNACSFVPRTMLVHQPVFPCTFAGTLYEMASRFELGCRPYPAASRWLHAPRSTIRG